MASRTLNRLEWTLAGPAATRRWGKRFARLLRPGDVVALVGELGAGKTTLVQGIARGWGYSGEVGSPTFALANEYEGPRGRLIHMDMYRLKAEELGAFPLDVVCTRDIARRLLPNLPRCSLRALAGYFGRAVGALRRSADHIKARRSSGKSWCACSRRTACPPGKRSTAGSPHRSSRPDRDDACGRCRAT